MAPDWTVYMTETEDTAASVALDVAAARESQDELPDLILLRLRAEELRDNGFPSKEDFDRVYALEDAIEKGFVSQPIRYVGRLTVRGVFFLHLYSADA